MCSVCSDAGCGCNGKLLAANFPFGIGLVVDGPAERRLFRQNGDDAFIEVTESSKAGSKRFFEVARDMPSGLGKMKVFETHQQADRKFLREKD